MSVSALTDRCYDCGQYLWAGGEPLRACLGDLPGVGEHWAWVELCDGCAAQRRRRRAMDLLAIGLVVSALTALAAYPFF